MGGAYFASLLRRYIYLSVASSPYSSGVDAMSSSPPPYSSSSLPSSIPYSALILAAYSSFLTSYHSCFVCSSFHPVTPPLTSVTLQSVSLDIGACPVNGTDKTAVDLGDIIRQELFIRGRDS